MIEARIRRGLNINLSRRNLLQAGITTAAAGPELLMAGCTNYLTEKTSNSNEAPDQLIDKIKRFEEKTGDKPVTSEELRHEYLPLVAELFTKETNSPLTHQEILDRTFIIRTSLTAEETSYLPVFDDEDGFIANPIIRKFRIDYPNVPISSYKAGKILDSIRNGNKIAWMDQDEKEIYLVLERLNSNTVPMNLLMDSIYNQNLLQFSGSGTIVNCQVRTPISQTRSAYFHEIAHLDSEFQHLRINPAITKAYEQVANIDSDYKIFFSEAKTIGGFRLEFKYRKPLEGASYELGLDELIADYISLKINIAHDLPYTFGYINKHTPQELSNLDIIITQSQLSLQEIAELHRRSEIEEFLKRVSNTAQNISFSQEDQMFTFVARNFIYQSIAPINWIELKKYYPQVDDTHYVYSQINTPEISSLQLNGKTTASSSGCLNSPS